MHPLHPTKARKTVKKDQTDPGKSGRKHEEEALDEALDESFPASDPIAVSFDPDSNKAKHGGQPQHSGNPPPQQRRK